MQRHAHYQNLLRMRGGQLNANQQRLIDAQPTQALKDARRRQFESYNTQLKQTEEKIARGETPQVWMEIGAENRRREAEANKLQQEINEAGGYDKYYYGDNEPIMFEPGDPDVPKASDGSPAVSARKNIKDGTWEVNFADGSKEYAFAGDERYSLPEYKIFADNPQEFIQRVAQQADNIRERQRKADESRSGVDKFFDGVNDTLSNIADVGTIFMPGLASTAYETFRPGTRAERGEREVQDFLNKALQTQSSGERNYENFRTGRFKSLLNYDPELKERIENYDKFGNSLQQTLSQMQGQGRERSISIERGGASKRSIETLKGLFDILSNPEVQKVRRENLEKAQQAQTEQQLLKAAQEGTAETKASLNTLLDQAGTAGELAENIPGLGTASKVLKGVDFANQLRKATGSVLTNTAEQFAPGASNLPQMQTLRGLFGNGTGGQMYCGDKKTPRGKTKGSTLACFKKGIGVGMMIERSKAPQAPPEKALEEMTIRELGQVAAKLKVPRYSRMKRAELIEAIQQLRG